MKRFVPIFTLFTSLVVNAQTKNVQLQWADQNFLLSNETSFFVPGFQSEYFSFHVPTKTVQAKVIVKNVQGNSVRIVSQNSQAVDLSKYKDINQKNIASSINPQIQLFTNKGETSAIITFNPIIKEGSGYSKINSIVFEVLGNKDEVKDEPVFTVTNSVLAQGNWFRFKVNETGVYRLDKNFLTQLGVPADVDPRTIKVYGYGGDMMPLANSLNRNFDLPEVAIQMQGEQDGVLNDNDFALFYAVGTKGWSAENATHLNLYSNDAFYYVTYGNGSGKRMQNYIEPTAAATITYNDYIARAYHEEDKKNIAQLSRKWFGEDFGNSFQLPFTLQTPLLNSSKPAKIGVNLAAISNTITNFGISLNNQSIGNQSVEAKSGDILAYEAYFSKQQSLNSETQSFQINFNNNGVPSSKGYVDFIAIDYYKHLAGYNKQFGFNFTDAVTQVGTGMFQINNAQAISQVWDVTNRYEPTYKTNTNTNFSLKIPLGELRQFVAVDQNDIYLPTAVANARIANQDLKGTLFANGNVDYIIITNNQFLAAANRLANLHRAKSNLNVKVVPLEAIYNEFSSGQQDIVAVRNFIRYAYHAGNQTLKYVNMFGDASTDYKSANDYLVPIYHYLYNDLSTSSSSNFHTVYTFATDDFYALLDDKEIIGSPDIIGLDVAIGRIPVNSQQQANAMVDKIEQYLSNDNSGRWKNVYTALADDVDSANDPVLQMALNDMVDELITYKPYFNVKKILADSYQQQVVAGGPRYPKAKEDFISSINSGSLLVNYLGHGSETTLGGERYFEIPDIDKLNNKGKYPLFTIMTCDFTRFDDPTQESGGERLFLRENAGAIGIFATNRKIFISNANEYTKLVSRWLFDYDNNLPNVSMAEALRLTKNDRVGQQALVSFVGDPALKLAMPKTDVVITHVNNESLESFTGSLRALDRIKLKGQVTTENGQIISNFNGDLALQLFDKNQGKVTLVNDGVGDPLSFTTLGETVFRGNATVTNGVFEIEFVVPKDIKIAVGEGKASFYATKEGAVLDDYTGANTTLKIGGVNENAAEDNKAPQIKLFMNDETFISGGITNNAPLFLAHLEDENGMNTASGIGHDMVAILDGDENNPFVMNEFYETEPNNFMKGFINYPFSNLKEGLHTITFKAWDVYNNLATATLDFVVTSSSDLQLDKVLNYPNPFVDYTEFWFQHNRPHEPLQVQVQILTVSGKIVKTINQTVVSDGFLSREIIWDGRDDFGDRIGKGVYIYKLKVKSTVSGQQAEKIEKLVIL
ncbi:type IX secretion system sortase PorU [Flavobacterium sp. xlx-214]|uniref:type IX secretion system sortase PorU n=1 Tax=unclassified Flavobacterium TaxID=196869 RepID=UPI0013D1ED6F|nr:MULTISPECIES: type IX secretion system sortase PorU [unclassified Flavobacterium]MBA5791183.1 type IX secretion system sortase PorU [Flavobacterium sp. xlx-221]QMI83647.1 type IX secretion system sortase PorU [Flavobacterium sp. xlx-214]